MPEVFRVGEVAKRTSVGVQTLHFYERMGLVPKAKRSSSNYRLYTMEEVHRVRFIRKAQALGLTLEEIKDVLDVKDHGKSPCRRVAEVAKERLGQIDAELTRLRAFRRALVAVLPQWEHDTAVERSCAGEFCDLIERLP